MHYISIQHLFAAGGNQVMVLLRTIVADIVPQEEQTAVYGKMGAYFGLGFILGPVIGGNLLELENGFSYIAFLAAALTATNCGKLKFQ